MRVQCFAHCMHAIARAKSLATIISPTMARATGVLAPALIYHPVVWCWVATEVFCNMRVQALLQALSPCSITVTISTSRKPPIQGTITDYTYHQ